MVSVVEGLVSAETMKEEEKAVQKGKSWRGRLEKKGDRLDTGGGGGGNAETCSYIQFITVSLMPRHKIATKQLEKPHKYAFKFQSIYSNMVPSINVKDFSKILLFHLIPILKF